MSQTLSLKVGQSKVLSFQCGYSNGTFRNPVDGDTNFEVDQPTLLKVEPVDKFNFKVTALLPGTVVFKTLYHLGPTLHYNDSIILDIPEVVTPPTVTSIAMKEIV